MDMLNPHCGISRDARGVVRLAVCNAGSLNILSSAVTDGVRAGFEKLAGDRSVRVVILTGESERSMIGGADIREMAALEPKSAEAFITRLRDLCEAIRRFPAPVIARLPGWCLGGGLEVAAACDLRIAAHDAKFGMPEVKVGIPSVIHAALLPRLLGESRAGWLLQTGETIDVARAESWGFVQERCAAGGLDDLVQRRAAQLAALPPQAVRQQKALLQHWQTVPPAQAVADSVEAFAAAYRTGEPQQHMGAFLARKRGARPAG